MNDSRSLWKHSRWCNAKIFGQGVTIDENYWNKKNMVTQVTKSWRCHVVYIQYWISLILAPKVNKNGKSPNAPRSSTCYTWPWEGCDWLREHARNVVSLNIKNMPKKLWSDNAGWEMVGSIHHMVLEKTKEILRAMQFMAISANESTSCDNQACFRWMQT